MNKSSADTISRSLLSTKMLVLTSLMTAITCILGPMSIPLPFSPVPLTLVNLILLISIYILGLKGAALSCLIYLLLGLAGLPIFSGFSGGFGKLAGPTGGYLIGYLFLVLTAGIFIRHFPDSRLIQAAGMTAGSLIMYGFGTLWLSYQMELTLSQGLAAGVIPYIPGDAAKIVLALMLGPVLYRRIQPVISAP